MILVLKSLSKITCTNGPFGWKTLYVSLLKNNVFGNKINVLASSSTSPVEWYFNLSNATSTFWMQLRLVEWYFDLLNDNSTCRMKLWLVEWYDLSSGTSILSNDLWPIECNFEFDNSISICRMQLRLWLPFWLVKWCVQILASTMPFRSVKCSFNFDCQFDLSNAVFRLRLRQFHFDLSKVVSTAISICSDCIFDFDNAFPKVHFDCLIPSRNSIFQSQCFSNNVFTVENGKQPLILPKP